MLYMRDRHKSFIEGKAVVFGLSDSSPVGGRNWNQHEYMAIAGNRLESVGEALFAMQQAAHAPARDDEDDAAIADAMRGWQRTIESAMVAYNLVRFLSVSSSGFLKGS